MPELRIDVHPAEPADPVIIRIAMHRKDLTEPEIHTFHGVDSAPFLHMLRFGLAEHTGDEALGAAAMVDFVRGVVVEEEQERFQRLLMTTSGGATIDAHYFEKLFRVLMEAYSRRPTRLSPGSSPTGPPTGVTTDPAWNGPVLTPQPPLLTG
ncbi:MULTISPECIES: hypothetical protein [Frankia]|uniref:Uncharacterized protein n=1 Tax=Frankia alni (strain DSM 45986 / CECT 9034 / ACN14a) TaxID=326424 RepID=Q0RMD4_FRAAA|nr:MULTISPECIES: hypothetical protein [Frankia]CAJ61317.1 hypothetical protein FRAAL2671 [Frankia alni ACN14a]